MTKPFEELRQAYKELLADNQQLTADNRKLRKEVTELKQLNDGYVKIIAKNQETNNKLMASVQKQTGGDLISRADAIEMAVDVETPQGTYERAIYVDDLMALPSADAVDCTELIEWLTEVVMDEENWELNAVAYGEIIARKLKKLGLLEVKDGYYIRPTEESYLNAFYDGFNTATLALSAEAESDDLIIKGAKGIKDGLYNITDGKLFKYKAKGGTVRTYPIVPSADRPTPNYITESANDVVEKNDEVIERPIIEHDRDWIIGCIKHDGFIKTDRFDKANQIILDALSADAVPTVIRAKTFMRKEDFDKWANEIKKQGENIVCIPCDAEYENGRPHGHWIRQDKYFQAFNETVTTYKCSVCGHEPYFGGNISKLNFCPNCGADMRETK